MFSSEVDHIRYLGHFEPCGPSAGQRSLDTGHRSLFINPFCLNWAILIKLNKLQFFLFSTTLEEKEQVSLTVLPLLRLCFDTFFQLGLMWVWNCMLPCFLGPLKYFSSSYSYSSASTQSLFNSAYCSHIPISLSPPLFLVRLDLFSFRRENSLGYISLFEISQSLAMLALFWLKGWVINGKQASLLVKLLSCCIIAAMAMKVPSEPVAASIFGQ